MSASGQACLELIKNRKFRFSDVFVASVSSAFMSLVGRGSLIADVQVHTLARGILIRYMQCIPGELDPLELQPSAAPTSWPFMQSGVPAAVRS